MKKIVRVNPIKKVNIFDGVAEKIDNLEKIKARRLWKETDQGSDIICAVIDSGIQINHPSLKDSIVGVHNFTSEGEENPLNVEDYSGHGTHVAGIIAAKDIGNGVIGVAPKAKLLIIKVIEKDGSGSYENVAKALKYASDWVGENGEKVNVINMSLGGSTPDDSLYRAVKYARRKGIILVSAAGNEGDGDNKTIEVSFPGFYKEVIQVGSVSENGVPSIFSNTNSNLDFVAPGEDILSTGLNSEYVKLTGTSMAAPFVTGGIALVLKKINKSSQYSTYSDVYEYLVKYADPKLDYSISQVGNGFIQLIE